MIGILNDGSEADAYFDDLTLKAKYDDKPAAGVVSTVKAKITLKKVTGATKYQIRYKVGSSTTWTTKSSTSNTFTISVPKGSKTTLQACVQNKAGWGKYGKSTVITASEK